MAGGSRKGFPFEREVAKALSMWLSGGAADDWVWRTQGSGGRWTNRRKVGKGTSGQAGDLTATDPGAKPFFDAFLVECKRGYGKWCLLDVVDRTPKMAEQTFSRWWARLRELAEAEHRLPLLITRRDQRAAIAWVPYAVLDFCIDPRRLVLVETDSSSDLAPCGFLLEEFMHSNASKVIQGAGVLLRETYHHA